MADRGAGDGRCLDHPPVDRGDVGAGAGCIWCFPSFVRPARPRMWRRVILVWGLIAVVMVLPFVQLFLSRGEAQLASSYPTTFEGWPIAERLLPCTAVLSD